MNKQLRFRTHPFRPRLAQSDHWSFGQKDRQTCWIDVSQCSHQRWRRLYEPICSQRSNLDGNILTPDRSLDSRYLHGKTTVRYNHTVEIYEDSRTLRSLSLQESNLDRYRYLELYSVTCTLIYRTQFCLSMAQSEKSHRSYRPGWRNWSARRTFAASCQ